jgi:virginiamycin B lyase
VKGPERRAAIEEHTLPDEASRPYGIAAGPDGALWFTEYQGNKIGRISTDGSIEEYPLPTLEAGPFGITAGPDGARGSRNLTRTK